MTDLFERVDFLLERSRTDDARKLLVPELMRAPDDPELHFHLARTAMIEEDFDEASEHLEQALAREPTHFGARLLSFHVRMQRDEYVQAEEFITDLIRERPYDADLIASYARLMLLTGHLEKSAALARESLSRDPENHEALLVQSLLATVRGQHGSAAATLEKLVRDDPEAYSVGATLFYSLVQRGDHRQAERVGQQLLRSRPNDSSIIEALVSLRTTTHWLAWPTYPFTRFGWLGVGVAWVVGIGGARLLEPDYPRAAGVWVAAYLALCVYSWVYPPLLSRWIKRRGL